MIGTETTGYRNFEEMAYLSKIIKACFDTASSADYFYFKAGIVVFVWFFFKHIIIIPSPSI